MLALDATNQEAKEAIAKIDSILDQKRTAFTPEPETEPEKPKQVGEHVATLEGKGRWLALALIPVLLLVFAFAFQRVVPVLFPTPTPTPTPTSTPMPTPTPIPTPTETLEEYCRDLLSYVDTVQEFIKASLSMPINVDSLEARRKMYEQWRALSPPNIAKPLHRDLLEYQSHLIDYIIARANGNDGLRMYHYQQAQYYLARVDQESAVPVNYEAEKCRNYLDQLGQ